MAAVWDPKVRRFRDPDTGRFVKVAGQLAALKINAPRVEPKFPKQVRRRKAPTRVPVEVAGDVAAAKSRDDARAALGGLRKADLLEVASALGMTTARRSHTADKLRSDIVEHGAGRRLDSDAIARTGGIPEPGQRGTATAASGEAPSADDFSNALATAHAERIQRDAKQAQRDAGAKEIEDEAATYRAAGDEQAAAALERVAAQYRRGLLTPDEAAGELGLIRQEFDPDVEDGELVVDRENLRRVEDARTIGDLRAVAREYGLRVPSYLRRSAETRLWLHNELQLRPGESADEYRARTGGQAGTPSSGWSVPFGAPAPGTRVWLEGHQAMGTVVRHTLVYDKDQNGIPLTYTPGTSLVVRIDNGGEVTLDPIFARVAPEAGAAVEPETSAEPADLARNTEMPALTGSPRQVAWATDIRNRAVDTATSLIGSKDLHTEEERQELLDLVLTAMARKPAAQDWITLFGRSGATPDQINAYWATPDERDRYQAIERVARQRIAATPVEPFRPQRRWQPFPNQTARRARG